MQNHRGVGLRGGRVKCTVTVTPGTAAFTYDGRGNLTGSGADIYTYTSENRMATAKSATYLGYDATDRLLFTGTAGGATTYFDYDGVQLTQERAQNGAILRRYVYGPGDDNPLVWYEGTGLTDKRFLHGLR